MKNDESLSESNKKEMSYLVAAHPTLRRSIYLSQYLALIIFCFFIFFDINSEWNLKYEVAKVKQNQKFIKEVILSKVQKIDVSFIGKFNIFVEDLESNKIKAQIYTTNNEPFAFNNNIHLKAEWVKNKDGNYIGFYPNFIEVEEHINAILSDRILGAINYIRLFSLGKGLAYIALSEVISLLSFSFILSIFIFSRRRKFTTAFSPDDIESESYCTLETSPFIDNFKFGTVSRIYGKRYRVKGSKKTVIWNGDPLIKKGYLCEYGNEIYFIPENWIDLSIFKTRLVDSYQTSTQPSLEDLKKLIVWRLPKNFIFKCLSIFLVTMIWGYIYNQNIINEAINLEPHSQIKTFNRKEKVIFKSHIEVGELAKVLIKTQDINNQGKYIIYQREYFMPVSFINSFYKKLDNNILIEKENSKIKFFYYPNINMVKQVAQNTSIFELTVSAFSNAPVILNLFSFIFGILFIVEVKRLFRRIKIFDERFKWEDLKKAQKVTISRLHELNFKKNKHSAISPHMGQVYQVLDQNIFVIWNGTPSKRCNGYLLCYEDQYYFFHEAWFINPQNEKEVA